MYDDRDKERLLSIYNSLRQINNYLGADGRRIRRSIQLPTKKGRRLQLPIERILSAIEQERDTLESAASAYVHNLEKTTEEAQQYRTLAGTAIYRATHIYGIPLRKIVTRKERKNVPIPRPNN